MCPMWRLHGDATRVFCEYESLVLEAGGIEPCRMLVFDSARAVFCRNFIQNLITAPSMTRVRAKLPVLFVTDEYLPRLAVVGAPGLVSAGSSRASLSDHNVDQFNMDVSSQAMD